MKQVEVKPFGVLADVIGTQSLLLYDVDTTESLVHQLEKKFPALKEKKYAIAVNKKIVTANTILDSNVIVALLPPFSGG